MSLKYVLNFKYLLIQKILHYYFILINTISVYYLIVNLYSAFLTETTDLMKPIQGKRTMI